MTDRVSYKELTIQFHIWFLLNIFPSFEYNQYTPLINYILILLTRELVLFIKTGQGSCSQYSIILIIYCGYQIVDFRSGISDFDLRFPISAPRFQIFDFRLYISDLRFQAIFRIIESEVLDMSYQKVVANQCTSGYGYVCLAALGPQI